MDEEKVDISVIIPCYNEMQVIETSVPLVQEILNSTKYSYEIILYDDGSTDGTREVGPQLAKNCNKLIWKTHSKNCGRGKTVTDGIRLARGRIVGFIDMDLEIPAIYIPPLVLEVEKGADIVVSTRLEPLFLRTLPFYKYPQAVMYWLMRLIITYGYNLLMKSLLNTPLNDTESGCKFFNKQNILTLLNEVEDHHWFWDTEIMVRAYYKGFKIIEYPSIFIRNFKKKSTVKIIKDSVYYLRKLIRFRRNILPKLLNDSKRGNT